MNSGAYDMETPSAGPRLEHSSAGIPSWRIFLAGSLALAATALWFGLAHQEARFARRAVDPDSTLLSPDELEDQLHV